MLMTTPKRYRAKIVKDALMIEYPHFDGVDTITFADIPAGKMMELAMFGLRERLSNAWISTYFMNNKNPDIAMKAVRKAAEELTSGRWSKS